MVAWSPYVIWGLGVVATAALSFHGWLAVQVIATARRLAELTVRFDAREEACHERLEWMRSLDDKIGLTAEKVSEIHGVIVGQQSHLHTNQGG